MTLAADVRTHRKLWKQHFIMQNRAIIARFCIKGESVGVNGITG